MISPWWSWTFAAVGILGMILVGRRLLVGWVVLALLQVVYLVYGVGTEQPGFVASSLVYFGVHVYNLRKWYREKDRERTKDADVER